MKLTILTCALVVVFSFSLMSLTANDGSAYFKGEDYDWNNVYQVILNGDDINIISDRLGNDIIDYMELDGESITSISAKSLNGAIVRNFSGTKLMGMRDSMFWRGDITSNTAHYYSNENIEGAFHDEDQGAYIGIAYLMDNDDNCIAYGNNYDRLVFNKSGSTDFVFYRRLTTGGRISEWDEEHFLIGGQTFSEGEEYVFLTRTYSDGTPVWQNAYDFGESFIVDIMPVTPEEAWILLKMNSGRIGLVSIDDQGEIGWSYLFTTGNANDNLFPAKMKFFSNDEKILIQGNNYIGNKSRAFLLTLDLNAAVLKGEKYGENVGHNRYLIFDIAKDNVDPYLVMAGGTSTTDRKQFEDIYIVKVNISEESNPYCDFSPKSFTRQILQADKIELDNCYSTFELSEYEVALPDEINHDFEPYNDCGLNYYVGECRCSAKIKPDCNPWMEINFE